MGECTLTTKNISTHTPLAGRDYVRRTEMENLRRFLLTRPLRDVTKRGVQCDGYKKFLLTRPLRDVTFADMWASRVVEISTHTPLAGRDGDAGRRNSPAV